MIKDVFDYLSKGVVRPLSALVAFVYIFTGFYEKFLSKYIRNKFKFLNDPNNNVAFGMIVTGLAIFLLALLIKIMGYRISFVWLLGGFGGMVGGALGLVPFSFIENKSNNDPKKVSHYMGIGALLGTIVAFLFGFFYVFRTGGTKDIPIGIVMGIVHFPFGVIIGIFFGMVFYYIANKNKGKAKGKGDVHKSIKV